MADELSDLECDVQTLTISPDITLTCQGKSWLIPASSIATQSAPLHRAIQPGFLEGDTLTIRLDDDDPAAVNTLAHWLRTRCYILNRNHANIPKHVGAIYLADRYLMTDLIAKAQGCLQRSLRDSSLDTDMLKYLAEIIFAPEAIDTVSGLLTDLRRHVCTFDMLLEYRDCIYSLIDEQDKLSHPLEDEINWIVKNLGHETIWLRDNPMQTPSKIGPKSEAGIESESVVDLSTATLQRLLDDGVTLRVSGRTTRWQRNTAESKATFLEQMSATGLLFDF